MKNPFKVKDGEKQNLIRLAVIAGSTLAILTLLGLIWDRLTGQAPRQFEGYTVIAYLPDPKGADAVELSKSVEAQNLRVGLKHAVILPSSVDSDGRFGNKVVDISEPLQSTVPNTVAQDLEIPTVEWVNPPRTQDQLLSFERVLENEP